LNLVVSFASIDPNVVFLRCMPQTPAAVHSGSPGLKPSPAQVAILSLNDSALRLTKGIFGAPNYPETRYVAKFADTVSLLEQSADKLLAVFEHCQRINKEGISSQDKSDLIALEMLPLALLRIHEKREAKLVALEQGLALDTYLNSHGGGLSLPAWYSEVLPLIKLVSELENLPGAEDLFKLSPSLKINSPALKDYLEAKAKLAQSPPSSAQSETLGRKAAEALEKLCETVATASDIHLEHHVDKIKRFKVVAAPDISVVEALSNIRKGLGALIDSWISTPDQELPAVSIYELVGKPGESDKSVICSKFEVASNGNAATECSTSLIARVIKLYASVHTALIEVRSIAEQNPAMKLGAQPFYRILDNDLARMLPGNGSITELVQKADAIEDPELSAALNHVVILRTSGSQGASAQSPLKEPYNAPLLRVLFKSYLAATDTTDEKFILDEITRSGIPSVADFLVKLKSILRTPASGKQLINFFNEKIDHCISATDPTYEKIGPVFLGLSVVVEDPKRARILRGNLKPSGYLNTITSKLLKIIHGFPAPSSYVESTRANLERNLSYTLKDYYGRREQRVLLQKAFERSMELLRNRSVWEHLPAKAVFMNGFLIAGRTGSGKTHLAIGIINHYKLPYAKITRAEMEKEASKSAKPEENTPNAKASAYGQYLARKAKDLEEMMKKTGSVVGVIFMDEMEAEFMDRELAAQTGDRDQISSTDAMLIAIEEIISSTPHIIFLGATNHKDFMDKAARRVGRFGFLLNIDEVSPQDIKDFIDGACNDNDLPPLSNSTDPKYQEVLGAVKDMIPLTIIMAVNNAYIQQVIANNGEPPNELDLSRLLDEINFIKKFLDTDTDQEAKSS
jgi:hypothetical protein